MISASDRRWNKYADGWQVGVLAVGIAAVVALLVVPRSVEPAGVPIPIVAPRDIADVRETTRARAATLDRPDVPEVVRALGGQIRAYGRAEAAGQPRPIESARVAVATLAAPALETSPADVAALEARYATAFAEAFRAFAATGEQSTDLVELGGDAMKTFVERGWMPESGAIPEDFDVVMESFYRRRFVALVGDDPALAEPKAESRARLAYLMRRAARSSDGDAAMMRYIDEASSLEPSYPVPYARGIVLYRMGRFEAAAASFDAFLEERSSGPYRLRAANYLRASVEAATP
jgi:hypothetical protein